jgi:hypothetical protein
VVRLPSHSVNQGIAQGLSKEYECLTGHKTIKISKIDNAGPTHVKNGRNLKEMVRRHINAVVIVTAVVAALTITAQSRNIMSRAARNKKKSHPHKL